MAFDPAKLNAYDFIKEMKATMANRLEERLESGEFFPVLQEAEKGILHHVKISYDDPSGKGRASATVKVHAPSKDHAKSYVQKDHKHKSNLIVHSATPLKEEVEHLDENVGKDTTDTDWTAMGDVEKDVVLKLRENGRQLGSDEGAYASGVLLLTFKNKQACEDYCTFLEDEDYVDTYEIEAVREDLVHGFVEDQEYDFGDIMFDKDFEFNVYVYVLPEIVLMPAEELEVGDEFEWDDEADNGFLSEVRRKIKVNFRGKKRIKMQCSPGFKWVPAMKTCKKISGSQVAVMRKAMRRAVLTKKSMGQSFKARVVRKARKANRFRKSFGLR